MVVINLEVEFSINLSLDFGNSSELGKEMNKLNEADISRVIEMAWEDRTPFEAIAIQFQLNESQVIRLMRKQMKASSFRMWRQRVSGRKTKHIAQRGFTVGRFVCPTQRLR